MTLPAWKLPEIRAAIVAAERHLPEDQRGSDLTRAHAATLRSASLWWASTDMTTLATTTADTLPAWTPDIVRPEPTGFMLWQSPIGRFRGPQPTGHTDHGAPAPSVMGDSHVIAIHWSILGEFLTLTFFGTVDPGPERDRSRPIWGQLFELGVFTTKASHDFQPDQTELDDAEVNAILHVLGASWLLMQQPTVATMRKAKPAGAGTSKRKPRKQDMVQIIDLRRLATDRTDTPGGDGEGREYRHRWLVRGHWRQQRVGPGRTQLRPVFVAPHIRGPEGAPLKEGRVNAWRR